MTGYQEPAEPFEKPTNAKEWAAVYAALAAPLPAASVDFRADSGGSQRDGKWTCRVVGYVDRTAVIERLNAVCGVGNWTHYWREIGALDREGNVQLARGYLQLWNGAKHWDVGTPSNSDPSKGAVSDLLKREATHVGVATYLGNLPGNLYCECVMKGDKVSYLTDEGVASLRARLAAWDGKPGTFPKSARPSSQAQHRQETQQEDASSPTPAAAPVATAKPTPAAKSAASAQADLATGPNGEPMASDQQLSAIGKLCVALGREAPTGRVTLEEAKTLIAELSAEYQKARRAS